MANTGKPLAIDAANCAGFEFAPRRSVYLSLDLTDFRKANALLTDIETVILCEGDAVVLAFTFETREPRLLASCSTVKKRLERKVYAVNDILENLAVNRFEFCVVFLPHGQVGLLCISAHGNLCGVVLKLSVVDQAVVNKAAGFERFV